MGKYVMEFGGIKNGYFRRNEYVKRNNNFRKNVKDIISEYNNTDVYYSAYQYEDENDIDNCRLDGSFYLDFDAEIDNEESFRKIVNQVKKVVLWLEEHFRISLETMNIYFSGNKGFHVTIPTLVLGIEPDKDLNRKYKDMAIFLSEKTRVDSIDIKIYDRKRLFRIPNSINGKTGLYKVPVTMGLQLADHFSFDDMKEWAKKPRKETKILLKKNDKASLEFEKCFKEFEEKLKSKKFKNNLKEKKYTDMPLPPCALKLLKQGALKGSRNNCSILLASSLIQRLGLEENELIETMTLWNEESNDPPLPEKELLTVIKSAIKMTEADKTYGCTTYKDFGYCDKENCEIAVRMAGLK